ncbi:MAG: DnaJ C-terminal domain-containing protein [Desulfobulbus sp.]|nr:DnaJ C-terminal domain-containing protein [Desulfobulbus sp.]
MPVEFQDYYQTLGVGRNATGPEIKKAFRTLARKFHPDVAKDTPKAEDRFSAINEANEVLSDPEKRRKYDALGANWNQPAQQGRQQEEGFTGGTAGGPEFHFEGTGFSDFFEQFLSGRGRASGGFDNFGRTGAAGMGGRTFAQRGHDLENDIMVTLEEALHGSTRMIRLERTDPRGGQPVSQTLRVTIPAGVHEGQMIRLAGKGLEGVDGGGSGNLYLRVVFAQHPDFQVRGADLYLDLDLSPWEAVLGATVPVPTLDGDVSLKIPAETSAKRRFRLRGKGLPDGDGARGDLYAIISLQTPTQSTPEQKALWESLAAISTFNPRKPL